MQKIPAILSLCIAKHKNILGVEMKLFPDSGTNICLARLQQIAQLNLDITSLKPCNKQVSAVGGSKFSYKKWLPVTSQIENNSTSQPLYISNKVDKIYLSKQGCLDLIILHPNFPTPINTSVLSIDTGSTNAQPPPTPAINSVNVSKLQKNILYPPINDNVPKLKQYLLDHFNDTAFNQCITFPEIKPQAAHIHHKANAEPYVRHTPIPVPYVNIVSIPHGRYF